MILKIQLNSLYQLFKFNYSFPKKKIKLPLIYHAIGYLTLPVKFIINIRQNKQMFILTQCNVNMLFKSKKINEINDIPITTIKKIKKKKHDIKHEIINDKFEALQQIYSKN